MNASLIHGMIKKIKFFSGKHNPKKLPTIRFHGLVLRSLWIVSLFWLSACQAVASSPQMEESDRQREADQPIQLTYWHTLTGTASSAQDELAAAFNTAQNRIRVTSEF